MGVFRGDVIAQHLGADGRPNPGGGEIVFDANRDAVQGAAIIPTHHRCLGVFGLVFDGCYGGHVQ